MAGGSKFSAEVPKGDGWGVEQAVVEAVAEIQAGEKSPLIPIVGVIDIKDVHIDPETHNVTAVVRVRRLEALTSLETIRKAQRMLLDQWAARRGEGAVLPFEEKEMIERAFGGVDVAQLEQDEREAKEDEDLTEIDRLRRHMVAVHGSDAATVDEWDDLDLRRYHHDEHAHDPATDGAHIDADHDEDWWAWRRVDLAEAEAEVGDETPDSVDAELADMTGSGPAPDFEHDARTVPGVDFQAEDEGDPDEKTS